MGLRRAARTTFEELADGDVMVISADRAKAVVLNGVGGVVWALCDGERSTDEIIDTIAEQFPSVARGQIATDVQVFIEQLTKNNMIDKGSE